jgi:hypothetical protein
MALKKDCNKKKKDDKKSHSNFIIFRENKFTIDYQKILKQRDRSLANQNT